MFIPDPIYSHPGSRVDKIPESKKLILKIQSKIRDVHPGSGLWVFSISVLRSGIQG
jgi:hypothetical protein